ncbi:hypothetical protein PRIPAC_80278, partial [Pristionchus pacificus]|uniref:Uncharacterized protein n=1 Tax=Pristionchus pacificus TaxID=54126 RepID=A0A2A6CKI5_PRIPA
MALTSERKRGSSAAGMYDPDGVLIHKGKHFAHGRDAIKEYHTPFTVAGDTTMTDDRYEATSDHIIVTAVIKTIVKSSATEIGGELSYIEIYS